MLTKTGKKEEGKEQIDETYYVAESCDCASLNCNPQAKLAEA